METGDSYLKHRKFVDNVSTTFPEMKSRWQVHRARLLSKSRSTAKRGGPIDLN